VSSFVSRKGHRNPNIIESKSIAGNNKFSINMSILCPTKHIGWVVLSYKIIVRGLAPSGTFTHNLINLVFAIPRVPFLHKSNLLGSGILLLVGTWVEAKSLRRDHLFC
jgi:hypothetical protein